MIYNTIAAIEILYLRFDKIHHFSSILLKQIYWIKNEANFILIGIKRDLTKSILGIIYFEY